MCQPAHGITKRIYFIDCVAKHERNYRLNDIQATFLLPRSALNRSTREIEYLFSFVRLRLGENGSHLLNKT